MSQPLELSFPQSDQDHRLQLVSMNGAIFAVLYSPLESQGPIQLNCSDWNLILLAPIRARGAVTITGSNLICLSEIASLEGPISLHSKKSFITFGTLFQSPTPALIHSEGKQHPFPDEVGSVMLYYRLLQQMIVCARSSEKNAPQEAQQHWLTFLSALSQKVTAQELSFDQMLAIWDK